ncbi:hypothetical protein MAR_003479 [Mya arenaria]|uniref:Protein quiver n=1 Tax=Mya arenaria TaxID=6604 RepID=A0ABY7GA79_MYAAR|nr:uncharacterized protein LOC128222594 [Mya arenaria]WAR29911.1 hypothetical protein MAR_003479 [Mya arenaria]
MDFKYLVCLFFTTCPVSEVLSLTCYQCDSITTPNCRDPFSSKGVNTAGCIGVCSKVKINEDHFLYGGEIVRDCLTTGFVYGGDTCEQASALGYSGEVCMCNANLCNAAGLTSATWSSIAITAILFSNHIAYRI